MSEKRNEYQEDGKGQKSHAEEEESTLAKPEEKRQPDRS